MSSTRYRFLAAAGSQERGKARSAVSGLQRQGRGKYGQCVLCGRVCSLTFHHLIPRKLHRRVFFKNNFSKEELHRGVEVCRLCHDGLHDFYDEMTLAKQFADITAIQRDKKLAGHFRWVARQKCE